MPKIWTLEELKARSPHDRAELYKNASRLAHTPEGAALKELLIESGLPFSEDACLKTDDPITIKMHEVIFSKEGRAAAIESTKVGDSAMAGVDPLLQSALGVDYGAHNMGTATAGGIVAELMKSLGYKKVGQKPLPSHCIAKTGATWE